MALRDAAAAAARRQQQQDAPQGEAERVAAIAAQMRADGIPERVIEAGGPDHYAAGQSQALFDAIQINAWQTVREIVEDPWTDAADQEIGKGALADAGHPRHNWGPEGPPPGSSTGRAEPHEPHGMEDLRRSINRAKARDPRTAQTAQEAPVTQTQAEAPANGSAPQALVQAAPVAVPQVLPAVVHGTQLRLTPEQHAALLAPIHSNRIQSKQGQSHLQAWDVRRYLNRIFGFGGWSLQTMSLELVAQVATQDGNRTKYTVIYRAQVRLTIRNADGTVGAVFEDGAAGDAINFPESKLGDAHDFAMKTALSQALKRAAVNLGDQFGLSLYNKGATGPVVQKTLVGPVRAGQADVAAIAASEKVEGDGDREGMLPDPRDLRDEALSRDTSRPRLSAIYRMVHPRNGDHPELGQHMIINETGDEEPLAQLVYRRLQETKKEGGGDE